MATREPLVSIIIPSLNQARFIEETIQSVLAQTYPHLDIVVVDGGSIDGTTNLLKKYDGAIRWVSEPDQGHADAVNKGVRLTSGQIIGWLNSDDVYFYKDSVQMVVDAFDQFADADIIYGDAAKIAEDDTILRMYFSLPYSKARMQRTNQITQPAAFLRRETALAESLKGYLSLDYEYWLRLGEAGFRFHHIPVVLAGDRQYRGRASISRHSIITGEIQQYKEHYGISPNHRFLSLIDRSLQATCRLRGLMFILGIMIAQNHDDYLAFPAKIDSFPKLIRRQILKSVVEVF